MNSFNFKSSVCTSREQSERLLALGLKKETADMYLQSVLNDEWSPFVPIAFPYSDRPEEIVAPDVVNAVPAWSLHRLLSLIPKDIEFQVSPMCGRNYTLPIELQITCELDICYIELNREEFKGFYGTDIYDSAIRCIEWLIKEGYFNKEYLEE